MKEKLTLEQIERMTWGDVIRHYFPPNSHQDDQVIDYILWNHTCYPFDTKTTLDQIYEYYLSTIK